MTREKHIQNSPLVNWTLGDWIRLFLIPTSFFFAITRIPWIISLWKTLSFNSPVDPGLLHIITMTILFCSPFIFFSAWKKGGFTNFNSIEKGGLISNMIYWPTVFVLVWLFSIFAIWLSGTLSTHLFIELFIEITNRLDILIISGTIFALILGIIFGLANGFKTEFN